jgi:hypothetical protein
MNLTRKQINFLKIFGFLLMIGLMVVLNNNQENARNHSGKKASGDIGITINSLGIAPIAAEIPGKTEGALPLKLISNPNSTFLFLFNQSREIIIGCRYIQFQKLFYTYCSQLQNNFLIEFLATMRNKDIR